MNNREGSQRVSRVLGDKGVARQSEEGTVWGSQKSKRTLRT